MTLKKTRLTQDHSHRGQSTYQIIEFRVDGSNTTPSPPWSMTNPSSNTNMAAVYFQATQARFVIYANTDKKHLIFWVNSNDQSRAFH